MKSVDELWTLPDPEAGVGDPAQTCFVALDGSVELAELEAELHPRERLRASELVDRRRRTFVGGRVAMRRALAALGVEGAGEIGSDERGAPLLPNVVVGSIAHKDELAVAVAELRRGEATLGVDLEPLRDLSEGVARRVLRDEELAALERLEACERPLRLLAAFAAKEAVYKAIDPFLRRYVGFREVGLGWQPRGGFVVHGDVLAGLAVSGSVTRRRLPGHEGVVLALARARRA